MVRSISSVSSSFFDLNDYEAYRATLSDEARERFDRAPRHERRLQVIGWRVEQAALEEQNVDAQTEVSLPATVRPDQSGPVVGSSGQAPPVVPREPMLEPEPEGPPRGPGHRRAEDWENPYAIDAFQLGPVVLTYHPDAVGFNVNHLFHGHEFLCEFLFVLLRRGHDPQLRVRLQRSEQRHPPAVRVVAAAELAWPLEAVLFRPPSRHPLREVYTRVFNFNNAVVRCWSMEWPAEPNSTADWGIRFSDNSRNRWALIINRTLVMLESRDPREYLPYMALLGNVLFTPPPSFPYRTLERMLPLLDHYRREILRRQHPLPEGYSAEDFLVDCLVLGACFPIECGLWRLGSGEFSVVRPLVGWTTLSPEGRRMWLRNIIVLYQVVATHAFGDYVDE